MNARLISLQFSFTNSDAVPHSVRCLSPETPEERTERKSHASGAMIIQPTENCSLEKLLDELYANGYCLVDAFNKTRLDHKQLPGMKTYHIVRFIFARADAATQSEAFQAKSAAVYADLRKICSGAFWRVRAFRNPFYLKGEEIPGEFTISLNLEARKPRLYPDGQEVKSWEKDAEGRRIGDSPLPLKASWRVRCTYGQILLD